MATIYVIHYYDPRSSEYHLNGREDVCWDKGAFTDKGVAEEVANGIRMFQEEGDPTTYSVRPLDLHEDTDFGTWVSHEMAKTSERHAG